MGIRSRTAVQWMPSLGHSYFLFVDGAPMYRLTEFKSLDLLTMLAFTMLAAAAGPLAVAAEADEPPQVAKKIAHTADDMLGLTKEKPKEGRFVKVGDLYMVPYTTVIPGSEVKYTMVPIPGGEFLIGSSGEEKNRKPDEGPQRKITIEPFWMAQYEITGNEYLEFLEIYHAFQDFKHDGIRVVTEENEIDAVAAPTMLYDPTFPYDIHADRRRPAVSMTQYAAKQYTHWLSGITGRQYRLPSEAEWEYACRAGTKTAFHFGDDASKLGEYAWHHGNSDEHAHIVGQKKPNPWGLYDMHGNVWEWTLDMYHTNGYARLSKKTHRAADALAWPTKLYPRVLRGGSWDEEPDRCRAAAKLASDDETWKENEANLPLSPWWFTEYETSAIGFRIVRPFARLPKQEMARYWKPHVKELKEDLEIRLTDGRGALGLVDKQLPAAIKNLKDGKEE